MLARIRTTLPVHPTTGLRAVGYRKDGRAIWPIAGASEPAPEPAPAPAPAPAPLAPAPPAPAPPAPAPTPAPGDNLPSDPEALKAMIGELRRENAGHRTGKTAAEQEAAQAKAIVDAINAALNPGQAADPTKLAEQLATTNAGKRDAEVRLAVFQAAATAGANANALLDRNSFTKAVEGLDPAAADFTTQVAAAITAAVAADPTLKTGQAPGKSGTEFPGGPGGDRQLTEDDLKSMTPEQIVEAQEKGLLKTLLGG